MKKVEKNSKQDYNARKSFIDGKRKAAILISSGRAREAEVLLLNSRQAWLRSKNYVDKKYYDGVKKVVEEHYKKELLHDSESGASSIKFACVSYGMRNFKQSFLKKYKLKSIREYGINTNTAYNNPCVYFGAYTMADINAIKNNQSDFKIVLFGGSDAMRQRNLRRLKAIPNLKFAAISKYISEDLARLGIEHKLVPITPVDHSTLNLELAPLGKDVYVYTSPFNPNFYGARIYESLIKMMPDIKFHICTHKSFSRERLINIYKRCFMGLRLVEHDGLPNTVIELGLMGRRTAHNGGLPSGIPWRDTKDLINIIKMEQKKVGKLPDKNIRLMTQDHLNNSVDWLKREYWE